MVDGSCNDNRNNASQLHSPDDDDDDDDHDHDDDDVIVEHEHTGGTYKLRDSRYLHIFKHALFICAL